MEMGQRVFLDEDLGHKKWQATYIAPLQPYTLAAFPPWGDSTGAGRVGLANANIRPFTLCPTVCTLFYGTIGQSLGD